FRAGTRYKTVGQELVCFLIIKLLSHFLNKLTVIIQLSEKLAGCFMVYFCRGTRIVVKRDSKILKRLFDNIMVLINYLLWGNAFFFSFHRYGYTMLITSAYKSHVFTL